VSYTAILGYLKTKLTAVPGIGVVHDYERWAADWATLVNLYVSNAKLNGWHVTRKVTSEDWSALPVVERYHTFEISGIYALKDADASEKTFQSLVEAVMSALRHDYTLGGNCLKAGPQKLATVETRMFGSVLCHVAVIELPVWERDQAN
jgi:hypothetical protein